MDLKKLLIEENEALWDRALRLIVGIALIAVFSLWLIKSYFNYVVLVVAIIALFTGISGHCSLYPLLGMSTKPSAARMRAKPAPAGRKAKRKAAGKKRK